MNEIHPYFHSCVRGEEEGGWRGEENEREKKGDKVEGNEGEGYFIGWESLEERREEGLKLHRKREGERISRGTKAN